MLQTHPHTHDLVLIGGGHAHALVLKAWGMRPLAGARLTLIDPQSVTAYTGMLPGYVAGHYRRSELDIDLVRLARFAGARLILGRALALDPTARTVAVEGHGTIAYDVVSLNFGVTARMDDLDGFAEFGIPVRPLAPFADRWRDFAKTAPKGSNITLIGGGVGGVELALAMAHRRPDATIRIVEAEAPLPGTRPRTKAILQRQIARAGISIVTGRPARLGPSRLYLETGESLATDFCVATAGARPLTWLQRAAVDQNDGFVSVDQHLRSTSHPTVFAAGDCAHMINSPRPKAGVYAVRQAPVLFHNLRAELTGAQPRPFHPQSDFLKLISLGRKSAVADKGLSVAGPWAWRWKNRIDSKFMDRLRDLPAMAAPALPPARTRGLDALTADPICGGCGAKVGWDALAPILNGGAEDAATLDLDQTKLVMSTDQLRGFSHDHALVARVAAQHALGDIYAMGATPISALANVTLPPLSAELQRRTLAEVMAAARDVLETAGAPIAGGHTTEGAELSIGFTVTGKCDRFPITQSGGRTGDALILTAEIGRGVVLAAEMKMLAPGRAVAKVWQAMAKGQAHAAEILRDAHAMTDVTGFGLAGHLNNLCTASRCGAEISLDAVPLTYGALKLSEMGVRSSLYDANRAMVAPAMTGNLEDPRANLLFDPQTSGGLLAAVAPDGAAALLKDLKAAGYAAAIIGNLTDTPPIIDITS